jgi:serine/threonine-protein kinase
MAEPRHDSHFAMSSAGAGPLQSSGSPPPRLGRYELIERIADGGMATIFVARVAGEAKHPPEQVAIKMIRDEFAGRGEFVAMFMDEARLVLRLCHPNIVRSREIGNESGHVFIAMELLFGQSLWALWEACRARGIRLGYETIAWIGARVADGLHYAHDLVDDDGTRLEIVHRDVNATNIFVTYDGQIKIIDFGLAKAANRASKTSAGIIKGKVAYMSPEQVVGAPVDRRTDIFALGATLWELGCDRRLFKHADEAETLRRVHAAEVPDPTRFVAGFPHALWRVLGRTLARERDRRYATAAELARALDAFGRTVEAGVDGSALARTMRDLFADDVACQMSRSAGARQGARSAQVQVPEGEEVDVTCSAPNVLTASGTSAPSVRGVAVSPRKGVLRVVIATAVVVAAVVASVVTLR